MYRWLVIALLTMMQAQIVWAATATYCPDEGSTTTTIVSHGETLHHSHTLTPESADAQQNGEHAHCDLCHLGCSMGVSRTDWPTHQPISDKHSLFSDLSSSSPPLPRPERPKWLLPA